MKIHTVHSVNNNRLSNKANRADYTLILAMQVPFSNEISSDSGNMLSNHSRLLLSALGLRYSITAFRLITKHLCKLLKLAKVLVILRLQIIRESMFN